MLWHSAGYLRCQVRLQRRVSRLVTVFFKKYYFIIARTTSRRICSWRALPAKHIHRPYVFFCVDRARNPTPGSSTTLSPTCSGKMARMSPALKWCHTSTAEAWKVLPFFESVAHIRRRRPRCGKLEVCFFFRFYVLENVLGCLKKSSRTSPGDSWQARQRLLGQSNLI